MGYYGPVSIKWRKDWPWVLFALLVVALVQIVLRSTDFVDPGMRNLVGKLVTFAIVGGVFIAVRGMPEPPAKGTQDWRTNPESARRRLAILRKGRWSAWGSAVLIVLFVVTGIASGDLLNPLLIGLVALFLGLLVGRWVLGRRLQKVLDGHERDCAGA